MSLDVHLRAFELINRPYEVAVRAAQLIVEMSASHSWLAEREDEILAIVSTDLALFPNKPPSLTSNMSLIRILCCMLVTSKPHVLTELGVEFYKSFIQLVHDRVNEIVLVWPL